MTCIIIEDQPPAQRILKRYIDDVGTLELRGVFSDAIHAMDFLRNESVDLMFLDIHLPKLSGIDFLKSIPHPPLVILTTAFSDYALEGYELNVVDYLLKPFSFQRFVKAVSKVGLMAYKPVTGQMTDQGLIRREIFVKSGYDYIKVPIADILFIGAATDYTEVFMEAKRVLSTDSLRVWMERLPQSVFVQIHKSYIVNTEKIDKVSASQIHLDNGTALPIGRTYKEAFLSRFLNE